MSNPKSWATRPGRRGAALGAARLAAAAVVVAAAALVSASSALAHARVSPAVSLAKELQLYSLAVPTEKENLTTKQIVLTVPNGFGIDSFVAAPGWTRKVQQTGTGEDAVVQKVTWTGGSTPTGEDSLFQFLAQPSSSGTYTFQVEQTYSDGSIVDWTGPESSDSPGARDRSEELARRRRDEHAHDRGVGARGARVAGRDRCLAVRRR